MKPPGVVRDVEDEAGAGAGAGGGADETVTAEVDPEAQTRPAEGAAVAGPRVPRSPKLTGRSMELGPTLTADGALESGAVGDGGLAQPQPSRLPAPLQTRDRERYDVLGEHGRGGLGTVARAYDKELGRQVAIKELLRRGVGEVRFLREALITARLEHPGIVPIHEAGRWPDGTPFYVMKLVSGRSLKELIEERQTVEERIQLLHHVIAVADAMAYAHKRKIIHRDLKPSNVIAGDFGETVVIDWGLAKDLSADEAEPAAQLPYRMPIQADLTETGSVLGTPMYMPPEQWRGEAVDQRADVFAIGAMLWELCSLQRVPPTEPRLRDRMLARANIDGDLAAIVAKALDPIPARRYRDAGELADDLKAFKSGARIAARSYSPFAVIAHWTRRHRALAATIAAALVLALAGTVFYVRNIAVERDRADAARAVANTERDNARLSEATALLDKDPTRARDLLASMPVQTPRHALLRSRANHGAATHVIPIPRGVAKLRRHPVTSSIAVIALDGELGLIEPGGSEVRSVDRDAQGPLTWHGDHWIYSRKPSASPSVTVATTSAPQPLAETGSLLASNQSSLLSAEDQIYALDSGNLYVIGPSGATLVEREVQGIAGNQDLLLVCTKAHELVVKRKGTPQQWSRCANAPSAWPMATAGNDYAALLDPTTILLVRNGNALELTTDKVEGEYELSLASTGLLAMADFTGKIWFVRSQSKRLELGPPHSARPMSVATAGHFAAWGFTDGTVIAIDTQTNDMWKFVGHNSAAIYLAIDEQRRQVISAGGTEVRVWTLVPKPLTRLDPMPHLVFHLVPSLDGKRAILDAEDGGVHTWNFQAGTLQEVHRHRDMAYGVAWLGDTMCSAGYDGRVICTDPSPTTTEILSGAKGIRRMIGSPDHRRFAIATEDGKLREFDGELRTLFEHDSEPYQMAYSPDGHWLASGATDGSVIVWDVSQRRIRSKTSAHSKLVTNLGWRDGDLWTTSSDGTLKQWRNDTGEMSPLQTAYTSTGSLRLLRLLPEGWIANANTRELIISHAALQGVLRLDLDRNLGGIETSPDHRYVAARTSAEVVVIDLKRLALATVPIAASGTGFVGFIGNNLLAVSKADGVFTASLEQLTFEHFTSTRP